MSLQAQSQYKPQFPEAHAFLLDTYERLLQARSEKEIAIWAARFEEFMHTLRALKEGGAFSAAFVKRFHQDIENVMLQVHGHVDMNKLTAKQKNLASEYAGIKSLAAMFGGVIRTAPAVRNEKSSAGGFSFYRQLSVSVVLCARHLVRRVAQFTRGDCDDHDSARRS